jgi:hypothetical protein
MLAAQQDMACNGYGGRGQHQNTEQKVFCYKPKIQGIKRKHIMAEKQSGSRCSPPNNQKQDQNNTKSSFCGGAWRPSSSGKTLQESHCGTVGSDARRALVAKKMTWALLHW